MEDAVTKRSVAEIVADLLVAEGLAEAESGYGHATGHKIADRLQEAGLLAGQAPPSDALRPPCPTCGGFEMRGMVEGIEMGLDCPDCTDGRMSWEWGWAIVAAVLSTHHWNDSDLREVRP